jgi:hypothetical protein
MTSVRRALALSFAERYVLIAIFLFSNILVARLLNCEEIGIYSVSLAVIAVAQVLRDFGIGNFLIQEKELTEAHVRTAFSNSLLAGGKAQASSAGVQRPLSFLHDGAALGWHIDAFHGETPSNQSQYGQELVARSDSADSLAASLNRLKLLDLTQAASKQAQWLPSHRRDVIAQQAFQLFDTLVRR